MYCSKVCCTHSVQSAIGLKKENPNRNVYILYRDMRTYGQREALYKQARKLGIIFINYELHGKPNVIENGQVIVGRCFWASSGLEPGRMLCIVPREHLRFPGEGARLLNKSGRLRRLSSQTGRGLP